MVRRRRSYRTRSSRPSTSTKSLCCRPATGQRCTPPSPASTEPSTTCRSCSRRVRRARSGRAAGALRRLLRRGSGHAHVLGRVRPRFGCRRGEPGPRPGQVGADSRPDPRQRWHRAQHLVPAGEPGRQAGSDRNRHRFRRPIPGRRGLRAFDPRPREPGWPPRAHRRGGRWPASRPGRPLTPGRRYGAPTVRRTAPSGLPQRSAVLRCRSPTYLLFCKARMCSSPARGPRPCPSEGPSLRERQSLVSSILLCRPMSPPTSPSWGSSSSISIGSCPSRPKPHRPSRSNWPGIWSAEVGDFLGSALIHVTPTVVACARWRRRRDAELERLDASSRN